VQHRFEQAAAVGLGGGEGKKAVAFAKVVELRVGGVTLSATFPDPAWLASIVQALELRS